MARPSKPLLSRDRIVTAALALIDEEGLAALSTRRLAAELGVSGPSLYNHFATKEAILDAAADTVISQVDLSMFGAGRDWRTALLEWGRSYRATLTDHPRIVPYLALGPGLRPAGLRMADAVFGGMVRAGWPPAQATRIGALMRYFVTGSALGSFPGSIAGGFVGDAAAYDPADHPHLGRAHLLAKRQNQVDGGAFETGLRALVDGLALQYRESAGEAADAWPDPGAGHGRGEDAGRDG